MTTYFDATLEAKSTGRVADSSRHEIQPDPIVCVSDLLWDEHWSSEQQLMSRLAKQGRVLYVERPVSLLSFFTKSSDAPVGRQLIRFLEGGIRQENANLTILTPPPVLPFRYVKPINMFNEWLRLRSIRGALKKLSATKPVLWIYSPDAGRIVGKFGESFSLYYCADDWAASDQWWNRAEDIRARENELGAKVDMIVGTSTKIVRRWSENHCHTMFVSNGADVGSFKQARENSLKIPEDLRKLARPRIGYVGFVDGRFDTRLYESAAAAHPEWSFVIVGPLSEGKVDLSRLRQMPNVHFLGSRTRAELPAYLKGFDVCTIPYVRNELSNSIFPLKLFEYLAAGRPVVATPLPELLPFVNHLRMGETPDQFRRALELSLTDPLELVSEEFLEANSWDVKAEHLWNTIISNIGEPSLAERQGVGLG